MYVQRVCLYFGTNGKTGRDIYCEILLKEHLNDTVIVDLANVQCLLFSVC